jgi:hypothetical protein
MALHTFHMVFRALKLTYPTRVHATTTFVQEPAPEGQADPVWTRVRKVKCPETFVLSAMVTWDFPARGDLPPVRLHWYDGGLKPPRPLDLDDATPLTAEGSYFEGEKGVLLSDGAGGGRKRTLLPEAKYKDFVPPPKTIPRTIGHYQEWIAAAKGGPPANCNFEFAKLIAETALLGVIATRTGRVLRWDAENMRFTNDSQANEYLNPAYRSGWSL